MLLAWPAAHTDWRDNLAEAEACYREIIAAIAAREAVVLLVPDEPSSARVAGLLGGSRFPVHHLVVPYDDTWVRDTGPLTVAFGDDSRGWLDFRFDGWGGKFDASRDDLLVERLAASAPFDVLPLRRFDWVLEGGAIETDGAGTLLSTARCLETREPSLTRSALGERLRDALGVQRVLWLEHGDLLGDDTDGHVDTIARFADPDTIVYQACDDPADPHFEPLQALATELAELRTMSGEPYRLIALPLPDPRYDGDRRLPAGYANFLVINGAVLMPTYDAPQDTEAAARLAQAFPQHRIVGVNCGVLIRQGGSLHCATMQLPAGTSSAWPEPDQGA